MSRRTMMGRDARPLGLMTIERWFAENRYGQRVVLNGLDVTNRCRWFNDETGEAELLVYDESGAAVIDGDHMKTELVHGAIEVS